MNSAYHIDSLIGDIAARRITNEELTSLIYKMISRSLYIDGMEVNPSEVKICYEMHIGINGLTKLEQRLINAHVDVVKECLHFVSEAEGFTPQRICVLSKLLTDNKSETYKELMQSPDAKADKMRFIDPLWHRIAKKAAVCTGECECIHLLGDMCGVLNMLVESMNSADSKSEKYRISFKSHNEIVKSGLLGEATGRIARSVMFAFQIKMGLSPIFISALVKDNYISECIKTATTGSDAFEEFMMSAAEQEIIKKRGISKEVNSKKVESRARKISGETALRTDICRQFKTNPGIKSRDVATLLNLNSNIVRRCVARMKEEGILQHFGPKKGGEWRVMIDLQDIN